MGIRIANDPPPPDDPLRSLVEREIVKYHDIIRQRLEVSLSKYKDQIVFEDVFQDTLIKAIERSGTFKPGNSIVPWLLRIGTNLVLDQLRKEKKQPREYTSDVFAELAAVPVFVRGDGAESSNEILEKMNQLAPADRRILEARYCDELTGEALMKAVGAPSLPATRKQLSRATKRFRDILGNDSEGRS